MGLLGTLLRTQKDVRIDFLEKENRRLRNRCNAKDAYFLELVSDGMRHGSSLAAKHMADYRKYKNGR